MDATKKPLVVPPSFSAYAEKHSIFSLFQNLLQDVLIQKPSDPLEYLIEKLSQTESDVPKIIVHGPPCSGKHTVSVVVARNLRVVHVVPRELVKVDDTEAGKEARSLHKQNKELPVRLWATLIANRLSRSDCQQKGWVLEGHPMTRIEAIELQARGILAKHFVFLDADDAVLCERAVGKRIDPRTGDVYHITFHPPQSSSVSDRLVTDPTASEGNVKIRTEEFRREIGAVQSCYSSISRRIEADQPKEDILAQVMDFLCTRQRTVAPHTPRVVLLGPTGSGRSSQAALLAEKYKLVNVSCDQLLRQAVTSQSKLGISMKPYLDKRITVPDELVMEVLKQRLGQLDATTRGWVMHGFPNSSSQANTLDKAGYLPNRVIFLDVPDDSVFDRLTNRQLDPLTGERYHLVDKPASTPEVRQRLVTHPDDQMETVKNRLGNQRLHLADIEDFYAERCQHVNGNLGPDRVLELIESYIIAPLPKQFINIDSEN